MSRPAVSGCGVGDRSAGARAYLGPRPEWPVTRWLMGRPAGETPAARSFEERRPSGVGLTTLSGAGRKPWGHLSDGGSAGRDREGSGGSGDRGERVGSEFSQDVVAAAGELAGDGQ